MSGTSAEIAADFSKLTLNATVTGYTGTETKAYLYYEYVNAIDEKVKGIGAAADGTQDGDAKTFVLTAVEANPVLTAGEPYYVKIYVVFSSAADAPNPDDVAIDAAAMLNTTVTAAAVNAVYDTEFATFTVEQNTAVKTSMDYTISGVKEADGNSGATTTAAIYYRENGTEDKCIKEEVSISNGAATGTITGLEQGLHYYFILMVGGAQITTKGSLEAGAEITLSKSTETGDRNVVGTYDVIRTIKAEVAEAAYGELTDPYTLEMWYKKTDDSTASFAKLGSETLDSANNYKAAMNSAKWTVLTPNTSYDFEYRLKEANADENATAIATLSDNGVKTNVATFTVTHDTANSSHSQHEMRIALDENEYANLKINIQAIELDAYLKKTSDADSDYADTNVDVLLEWIANYTATLTFTGLDSGTEYSLVLRNAAGEDVLSGSTLTFTTDAEPEDTREVKDISVIPTTTGAKITYTTVSDVNDGYVLCYVRKAAAEGEEAQSWVRKAFNDCYSGTRTSSFSISGLSPETVYEYLIGFGNSYYSAAEDLVNTATDKFTTLADKRKVTVTFDSKKVTEVTFKIAADDDGDDDYAYVAIYYREKAAEGEAPKTWQEYEDDNIWWSYEDIKYSYIDSFSMYGLSPATSYECMIGLYDNWNDYSEDTLINPVKLDFTTEADDRTITAAAKAGVTSAVIDYTVGGMVSEADMLDVYYKETDSSSWQHIDGGVSVTETISLTGLTANKKHEYVIGFEGWGNSAEELKNFDKAFKGEFDTVAEDRAINSTVTAKVTSAVINYTVSGMVSDSDYVVAYYREKIDGQSDTAGWVRIDYTEDDLFRLYELSAETTYEYILGFNAWGTSAEKLLESQKVAIKEFDTPADDRKVTAVSTTKMTEAVISYTTSGAVSEDDVIIGYYREQISGQGTEAGWIRMSTRATDSDSMFSISGLKPGTTYDYVIGFSDWGGTGAELAASAKTTLSEFKTTADNRQVEASVESRVTTAVISYTLSGDYSSSDSLRLYYKEDVSANWSYITLTKNANGTTTITGLTSETKYNYKIGFGDSVEGLVGVATGDFTTMADRRTLSDASTEVITTGKYPVVKLSYLFSGNIDEQYTYIHYFYKVKAEETAGTSAEWQKITDNTSATISKLSMSISDMDWNKTYEYAVVIANSTSISSPDVVTNESMKLAGTVTIPAREAATDIRLSQEKIYLNLGNYYMDEEGYYETQTRTLTASLTPVTAKEDLVWSSDKTNIATVDQNGCVTAQGVGTAKITVSVPGTDIKAECDVEVADYRIFISYGGQYAAKGYVSYSQNSISEETYNLYKYENGNGQIVTDLQVTSDNELIAKWSADENKLITGNMPGTAKLTFTAGNFKALLYVESLSTTQNIYVTDFEVYDKNWNDSNYTAINNGKDGFTIAYSKNLGLTYTAVLDEEALYPYGAENEYFKWEIVPAGSGIATVDEYGTVTPLKSGDVTLKITRSIDVGANEPKKLNAEIPLHIVDVPAEPDEEIYALVNVATTLKDIECPAGWTWKYPDTPLVVNGNYDYGEGYTNSYDFEAVCTSGAYPSECTITVNMAKVTGVSVLNSSDAVVEVGGDAGTEDSLEIQINTSYQGQFYYSAQNKYYNGYKIDIPDVSGLTITPKAAMDAYGRQKFSITAARAGNYTIKPVIKVGDKVLAQATYKFKAVSGTNAESVKLELADKTKGVVTEENGKIYIDLYSENEVGGVKPASSVTIFNVKAILKDRIDAKTPGINASATSASLSNTKLTWKSSDAKVIAVAAASDTHTAAVTVKGEGHAILTATVKDAVGRSGKLNVEIRNHAPRVDTSKVTINKAYDYTTKDGRTLAYNSAGSVEVVPVYDESIYKVRVYKGDAESSDLRVYTYSGGDKYGKRYVIGPRSDKAESGDYELRVTTDMGKTYKYPIKVTVVDKAPKVTVKSNNTVNLFYTDAAPEITVKVSGTDNGISSVTWKDKTAEAGDGFTSVWDKDSYNGYIYRGAQESIKLNNKHKPVSADIAKGTFTVKLRGYRQAYTVSGTIKYNYKKPAIVSDKANTTLAPSIGQNSSSFRLLNKDTKSYIYLNSYNVTCQNKSVTMSIDGYYVDYSYSGKTSGSEKIELKLMAASWREPVIVNHTIKLSKPNVLLSTPQIVLNTNEIGWAYTFVYDKNSGSRIYCDDIVYEGKDAKSAALLTDGKLEFIKTGAGDNNYHYGVGVIQKRTEESIAPGTYSYKITPYYRDAEGNRQALKTLILKVKVVNKAVTAKVKTKNTLDLIKADSYSNYIAITSTFANIGSYYTINNIRLVGDYSDYFDFYGYNYNNNNYTGNGELYISEYGIENLKAGQKYRLALEYTITMAAGDTFTVTSDAFIVTPKQSAPKVIVSNNNQTLYAGVKSELSEDYEQYSESYYRLYQFSAPYTYKEGKVTYTDYYTITSIHGGLDCNKDGEADIKVEWNTYEDDSYDGSVSARVFMEDTAAVLTTTGAKGKTYTVPVTVELMGRDGISKDVKTSIKVTVKR